MGQSGVPSANRKPNESGSASQAVAWLVGWLTACATKVVGLLCLQRDGGTAEGDHWRGLLKYKITKTMPLKAVWPVQNVEDWSGSSDV